MIIVMHKLFKLSPDAGPIVHPRCMEAVDPLFERVKSLFDEVSLRIIKLTAQSDTKERNPKAVVIDDKYSV